VSFRPLLRIAVVALAAGVMALTAGAATAFAHIQVSPTVAAPNDAVRFTLLVPGELDQPTTKVELQIPAGVLPFSWGETPGWTRKLTQAADGSVASVTWTGSVPADGFVEFSFLAATPPEAGEISWKAVQTYGDGTVVRWIGPPDSEEPAAVTVISADAPRQNAGGENEEDGHGGGAATTPTETTPTETTPSETTPQAAPTASEADEGGTDRAARVLGALALVAGIAAVVIALRARRKREG
jgi:uncharacterized protein YcnI